jgi:GH15 family glucan-1,4-alpha-glucosidase
MPSPIEDYALIGDCLGAGLIDRTGSLDWLCLPRFDSGACFAALLGTPQHGRWLLTPAEPVLSVERHYRGDTLVLETTFTTASGVVSVIDFMPPRDEAPDVVRIVCGIRGDVPMRLELVIRFDYGSIVPWVTRVSDGIRAIAGADSLHLAAPVPLHGRDLTTLAEFVVREGERLPFVLTWHPSHLPEPAPVHAEAALVDTERFWSEWSARSTYDGPHAALVRRSLVTLKALTYAPTGGIVAAPTTSLPERIGGVRNWDYRFCWLRDATLTLCALMAAGHSEEALAFRGWLLRTVAGDPSRLQIMYGIAGERRLTELTLDWLPGYEASRPVRVGNAAHVQLQLDVYGELLDTMHQVRRLSLPSGDGEAWAVERAIVESLERLWREPDEGLWEIRGPRRHFVHSKVMAWVAFDRAIKAIECYGRKGPLEQWRAIRAEIHEQVCREGFDAELGSFVQSYGSKELDASLLMLLPVGFLPPGDPRMVGTVEAVRKHLLRDGFLLRYRCDPDLDGLPPGEGTFLPCSFWLVDALTLIGRRDEAVELFGRLVGLCNDIGLIAEQYDPTARRLVGNFPQAFTHVALVVSAFNLASSHPPALQRHAT